MNEVSISELKVSSAELRRVIKKTLLIIGAIVLALALFKYIQISRAIASHAAFAPAPEAITALLVQKASWQGVLEVVGSLEASKGVTISAEEPGKVAKIGFESGVKVNKGDLLIQLDVSVEEAKLNSAQAMWELAQVNLKRALSLRGQKAISEQELNSAVAEERNRKGQVDELRAMLARKTITAPFDGRAGIRMVNEGEYIESGAKLVPLYALDPLFLNFSIPQQQVGSVKIGQSIEFTVDVFLNETFSAQVLAIDPQIDELTRNVRVQSTVSNSQERLRPGMFVRAKLILGESQEVLSVPASAINYAPYGNSVYVVENMKDPNGKDYLGVRQQFVKLGEARGDQVAVLEGLKAGEQVATSGVFKLRPGAAVLVNNEVTPKNEIAPKPEDT